MLRAVFRIYLIIGVLCFIGWDSRSPADEAVSGAPVLVLHDAPHDVLAVVEGQTLTHTIPFSNEGSAPLTLFEVLPACRCSTVEYHKTVLPGGSGRIVLSMDTEGFQGKATLKAVVTSNDPGGARRLVEIPVRVMPAVEVNPDRVFLSGCAGNVISKEVVIRSNTGESLELKIDGKTVPSEISCVLKTSEKDTSYTLVVRNRSTEPGSYRRIIHVKTNSTRRPVLKIPVFGRIQADVEVTPASVDFGRMRKDSYAAGRGNPVGNSAQAIRSPDADPAVSRDVFVRLNRGDSLDITGLEIDETLFRTELKAIETGKYYWIRIVPIVSGIRLGVTEAQLRIHTNDKRYSPLIVPISIQIQ